MKKLILGIVCILFSLVANAKIIYLDNNLEEPNIDENLYVNWADAYSAAASGDTIYIIGSNVGYGSVTISKPINLIGPGYLLNKNNQTQVNKKWAIFNSLSFLTGSDNSSVSGIAITSSSISAGIFLKDNIDNIIIENSYLPYINIEDRNDYNYENIQVKRCYLWYSGLYSSTSISYNGICSNLIFSNNIVNGTIRVPNGSNGIFINNLFLSNELYFGTSSSLEIVNNIYTNSSDDKFTIQPLPNASVHHNFSVTGIFGSENNNISAPLATLFVSENNNTTDGKYQLAEQSPAREAGDKGTDMGPFGGADPYRLSGLPNLPNIYEIVTGGFVVGDTLPVRVKIKQIKQ